MSDGPVPAISLGQCTRAGDGQENRDFHGAVVPLPPALAAKGVAAAMADGISSSAFGAPAAQAAVGSFLADYYATPDTWTAKRSARHVIEAANAWLHAQTRRSGAGNPDHGHVTTFDALVLKGRQAHLFHVGDGRVARLEGDTLEPLTDDHRVVLSARESYLDRALGASAHVEIDYRALSVAPGDTFLMTTDGVHEHVPPAALVATLRASADLDAAARAIVAAALAAGSRDDLTVQIVRVEALPAEAMNDAPPDDGLPPPAATLPEPGATFDGWHVLGTIHASSRSHLFDAVDVDTGERAVLKFPSTEARDDPDARYRLAMEEWVARRVSSPHLLRAAVDRPRTSLYCAMERIEGRTLRAWASDRPAPDLERVRGVLTATAAALQAMHRRGLVHRDLRPENVLVGASDHVTVIDFGAVRVESHDELAPDRAILGTHQYTAPEVLLGEPATQACDLYALGAIAHELLSGRLPYGALMARARTLGEQRRVPCEALVREGGGVPAHVDAAIRRAVHPDPRRRHADVSAFVAALARPDASRTPRARPLLERNPHRFWQATTLALALAVIALLIGRTP